MQGPRFLSPNLQIIEKSPFHHILPCCHRNASLAVSSPYPHCPCSITLSSNLPLLYPTHPSLFLKQGRRQFDYHNPVAATRIGQMVQPNSVHPSPCSASIILLTPSPFAWTALSVGNIAPHHCRLSVHDRDCSSHLHRGKRCAASHSGRTRQDRINVCCRRTGASINRCLKLAKNAFDILKLN